jgi:cobalt-zinc-cadmium efflux system membrane fusion protein
VLALSPAHADEVTLNVSAQDVNAVHAGNPVRLEIVGTDLSSTGRIAGISNAIDPATQTATVVASGLPAGAPIGSIVQATIVTAHRSGVVVPQTAIVQDPQTGNSVVFLANVNAAGTLSFAQRVVKVAMRNDTKALIASGLRGGERIASRGGFALLAPAGGGDD